MKLLLIEDSPHIAGALYYALRNDYTMEIARDGTSGLSRASTYEFDVIVLDLSLPDISGLEVCQQIRKRGIVTPILILSAECKVLTKINLLDTGADDYLTKPFSLGELKARLRVLIRKARGETAKPARIAFEDLELDSDRHIVVRAGETIRLRRKEFALLECLMQHAGKVVSRDRLTAHAWNGTDDPWKNTIDVHIKYLRDKVDRPYSSSLIKTVHGLGYKLEPSQVPVVIQ